LAAAGNDAAPVAGSRIASRLELWFDMNQFLRRRGQISYAKPGFKPARRAGNDRQGIGGAPNCRIRRSGDDMKMSKWVKAQLVLALVAIIGLSLGGVASAEMGQPTNWQLGLQGAATPVAESIHWFHTFLLYIITAIVIFVLILLIIVMTKFSRKANPNPSRTTHNTVLEVIWTVVPVLILVAIAVPSFRLLFLQLDTPKADLTIKAVGKQWYWTYSYPDQGAFEFDSLLAANKAPRLLAVDNEVVVPVGKVVRVQVTAADVIHSFAVPSFGIKVDAVPGRLNETWFKAEREGMYYGQCSELCGKDHAFMPIAVRVVSEKDFEAWIEQAKQKFATRAPAGAFAAIFNTTR